MPPFSDDTELASLLQQIDAVLVTHLHREPLLPEKGDFKAAIAEQSLSERVTVPDDGAWWTLAQPEN
ncbi:hypothetical protein F0L74_17660 [Chitinophaga agrisoli]|uniref:Uncharacterized protein n=1 Tax=Chitinophaga agrisoli TaxID=2607653 RepID=A0A5B2VTQ9_9BACT|nr:hypothetical protein [Chitinophaga agrisoli]KAA2241702.1 hypothetical protein F0L74_17660 [Chitinophaga agrisoli]